MAGNRKKIEGRVKRKEYLEYLTYVRASERRNRVIGKSIEEIRRDFCRLYDFESIYINI